MTGKQTRPPMDLVRRIVAEEAAHAGIRPQCIFAKDRRKTVSWARWRVCKRLHAMNQFSMSGIGRVLNLDHSSIFHALRQNTEGDAPKLRTVREHDYVIRVLEWAPPPPRAKLPSQIDVSKSKKMGSGREWTSNLNRDGGDLRRQSQEARTARRFEV